jgi:hypothetical protein
MLSLTDALSSRYLTFTSLRDAGIDAGRAATVTDILHGPEPADGEDPAAWPAWCDSFRLELGSDEDWRPAPDDHFEPDEQAWLDYCEWSSRLETEARLHEQDEAAERRAIMERWHEQEAGR